MKILSKRIKIILIASVTVLFALIFLFMNNSKIYCATDTSLSVASLGTKGFFSDGIALKEPETAERIFDSDNGYKKQSFEPTEWRYPDQDKTCNMATRNEESFFLYGKDKNNVALKLKPINSETYWTNYIAEDYVIVYAKQMVRFPTNVTRNNDAMTLNSYLLNSYYKNDKDSTKIDTGIILYRQSERVEYLWNATWESVQLKDNSTFLIEAPKFVEIAILYELRERKGTGSHYSHCVARYCLEVV